MKKKDEGNPIEWTIDGYDILINYPEKLYWPEEKITKLDMLNYYRILADIMLPYFKNRPVTLRCFPRGISDFSYYKRNFDLDTGNLIKTLPYAEVSQDKIIQVPIINNEAGLVYLSSKGCIEFHLWSSKMPNYENPDIVIFDLDVSSKASFKKVLEAALCLNKLLNDLNIIGYVKTSGGTGLHVYVPIEAKYSFEYVRNWVKKIGEQLSKRHPNLITTKENSGATHKSEMIVIDYLQNVISRNTAAPYTVRANSGAPVSAPLSWEEVEKGGFEPKDFNLKNMPDRVAKMGDLFMDVLINKQVIPHSFV